jgi:hypothetical protein
MKIDYKSYPILEKLLRGYLGQIPVSQLDSSFANAIGVKFNDYFKLFQKGFNEQVSVISESFELAASKASPKLMDLARDIMTNDIADFEVKGTFIYKNFVFMINYETKQGSENQELCFYMFYKNGVPLAMSCMSDKHDIKETYWISNFYYDEVTNIGIKEWAYIKTWQIIMVQMFKSYASVETKILLPNQKVMDIVCKYKNDTKLKLTFLDSKWFTNLVKSDGFTVRGHFRLQPKKINGEMSKELIWISDFQKTGYTAPARMLS